VLPFPQCALLLTIPYRRSSVASVPSIALLSTFDRPPRKSGSFHSHINLLFRFDVFPRMSSLFPGIPNATTLCPSHGPPCQTNSSDHPSSPPPPLSSKFPTENPVRTIPPPGPEPPGSAPILFPSESSRTPSSAENTFSVLFLFR